MRKTLGLIVMLLVVSLFLCQLGSENTNPHLGEVACDECHLGVPTAGDAGSKLFVADIETLCLRCHRDITLAMSHPVALKPTFSLPVDMPLDWKGELTCSTCHYMHEHDDQPYHDQAVFLRRNSVGQAFCQECHQQGFMMNRTLGHSLAKSDAHYTPYGSSAAADSFGGTDASPLLDESSSACLTCHDGSIARDEGTTEMSAGAISLGAGIWRHDGDYGRNSHPLGVRYGDARRRRSGYRDAAMLPSVIRLPGGKVECVSCHNPYSTNDSLLVIDNRGSRLCLTCHLK